MATGFTLKIPKFNRAKENRKKRKRIHSSLSFKESDSETSLDDVIDLLDSDSDSPPSDIVTKKPSPSRKGKKRPRKKVLASLSNAKRMVIPIPSFQMTRKKKESDLSKRLSKLEREFFDEDGEDDGDGDENQSQPSKGNEADPKTNSNATGIQGVQNRHSGKGESTRNTSSMIKETSRQNFLYKETTYSSKLTDGTSETVPNDICVERQLSPSASCDREQQDANENEGIEKVLEPHKVAEPVEEVLSESPQRENNQETTVDIVTNPNENEDCDDLNIVDFGANDDCDCVENDSTAGNYQDRSSSNKGDNDIMEQAPPSTKPADNTPTSRFDLEHEVDLLFQKSDTNTITMKIFCKELERRIGVSLEKPVKKKVKARVMALLRGEIVPSSTLERKVESSNVENRLKNGKEGVVVENSALSGIENGSSDTAAASDAGSSHDKDVMLPTMSESPADAGKTSENTLSSSTNENQSYIEVANSSEPISHQAQLQNASDNTIPRPVEIRKPNSNEHCVEIETKNTQPTEVEKPTNKKISITSKPTDQGPAISKEPQPEKPTKSKKATTSKPKRQRKKKPKASEIVEKSAEEPKPTECTKVVPAKKPTQTRKRPRKAAACALCKTCPCQRANTSNDCENIATLDVKDFSRSDNAVERTLLRRLQKLEQSTESMEEQTETVRRRLKKHRRDVAKRRERLEGSTDNGNKTGHSYFLPDAEVFEQQQGEGQGLASGVAGRARNRVFQSKYRVDDCTLLLSPCVPLKSNSLF